MNQGFCNISDEFFIFAADFKKDPQKTDRPIGVNKIWCSKIILRIHSIELMMRKLLLLFALLPFCLFAQKTDSDTLKLKADASLNGFWQTGNVTTFIFRTRANLSYRPWDKWILTSRNSYLYQEFGRVKADVDIESLNFLSFDPDRRFFPLVIGIVTSNFRREIDLRYKIGAGVTYKLFDSEDVKLRFSLSSEYENTHFDKDQFNFDEYNGSTYINTVRSTLWVSGEYHVFDKKLILKHIAFFQPSLGDSNNFRWEADLTAELPISKKFAFNANYLHTYERIVVEDQKQADRFLTFGFTYKSYE